MKRIAGKRHYYPKNKKSRWLDCEPTACYSSTETAPGMWGCGECSDTESPAFRTSGDRLKPLVPDVR